MIATVLIIGVICKHAVLSRAGRIEAINFANAKFWICRDLCIADPAVKIYFHQ